MAYRCSKYNACCLLSCRDNSTLNVCLCRPTMTLHHGQGHRNEHEQICHAQVYRHAKFQCHSLNTVRHMTIPRKLNICQVCDALVTLNAGQGHRTNKRLYRHLVGLSPQQT